MPGPDRSELAQQIHLALPLAAQQVGFQLMGAVDAALLGRYDDAALAGAGVGNNLLFVITAIGMGVVMGLDTLIPQSLGAGRPGEAQRTMHAGIRLALIVGLPATLLTLAAPRLLGMLPIAQPVLEQARIYVYARAPGIVPFLITIALRSYLAAHGKTRPLLVAMVAGNAANAALDVALIFGISAIGLPALGVIGAAGATTFVQLVTVAVYALAVRGITRELTPAERAARPSRDEIRAVVRLGAPIAGQLVAEIGIFGVAGVLAASLGTLPAAAHSIALNLASFTFSFAVGVASATSVRVGHAVGAGDLALARARGFIGMKIGMVTMAGFAVILVAAPAPVARLFTDDAAVVAAAIPLLQIAALFQLSDGAQTIGAGALRGLGNTRATLIANVIGHYAIGLPIALLLGFALHLGAPGLWWGLSAGLTATAAGLIQRFIASTAVHS